MALNLERIGYRYPAYTYEVSREKVREFAAAVGFDHPAYHSHARDVPAGKVPVPPTFPACFTVLLDGPVLGDPGLGAHPNLMHGQQEYAYHRPLRVGDVLECWPWIVDIKQRRGLELLTLQIDCADLDGQPVLTSRGVLIFLDEEQG